MKETLKVLVVTCASIGAVIGVGYAVQYIVDSSGGTNISDNRGVSDSDIEDESPQPEYDDVDAYVEEHDEYSSLSRDNWDCGYDEICDGHEAGYDWGSENSICDLDYDNGNSEAFNEGVRTWAYEDCYLVDLHREAEDYFERFRV